MKISTEQVSKVAQLARLGLSDDELQRFTGQLDAILHHVDQLNELDTEGVAGTSHVVPLVCPERADEIRESAPTESLLSRAPQQEENFFLVPKIIE